MCAVLARLISQPRLRQTVHRWRRCHLGTIGAIGLLGPWKPYL